MQCAECNRDFDPSRDDAITCSNRCRQARFRHRHRKPRPPAFHRDLFGCLSDFEARFTAWRRANPPLDDEGKAALTQALTLCGDGLLRLAQEMDGR